MFRLDHLMIEVSEPEVTANSIAAAFGLPLAWPLQECDDYTSIGVNFGALNIEFIQFRKRFGRSNTDFHGFSGIALATDSIEACEIFCHQHGLRWRIGEHTASHTTAPIEEDNIFPTIFSVCYHFDTSGWRQRLKTEFANARGGYYQLGRLKKLEIDQVDTSGVFDRLGIVSSQRNRVTFAGDKGHSGKVFTLLPNLEIAIA